MKRSSIFCVALLLAISMVSIGYTAKDVMTYLRDSASKQGHSVVFDLLGGWNATLNATGTSAAIPFMVGTNATPRSNTTAIPTAVGMDGVTFIGVCNFGEGKSNGSQRMTYYMFGNGTGATSLTTVTPAALNSTNQGPFTRFF